MHLKLDPSANTFRDVNSSRRMVNVPSTGKSFKTEFDLRTMGNDSQMKLKNATSKSPIQAAFSVMVDSKIPQLHEARQYNQSDSVQNLLRRPKHKTINRREEFTTEQKLMTAPLGMEDKTQFVNLPLITTLRGGLLQNQTEAHSRSPSMSVLLKQNSTLQAGEENEEDDVPGFNETVPHPPSFYDEDIRNWQNKFSKSIQEREKHKQRISSKYHVNCLNHNTNIIEQDKIFGKRSSSLAAPNASKSTFKGVLTRRKSRQSNYAPANIDIDYAGDSARFHHLIKYQNKPDVSPTTLNSVQFGMHLRNYKNTTDFSAHKPWQYPAVKSFDTKAQLQQMTTDMSLRHTSYKQKFDDQFKQKNAQELLHQFQVKDLNQTAQWQCQLRDLKETRRNQQIRQNRSELKEKK